MTEHKAGGGSGNVIGHIFRREHTGCHQTITY